MIEQLPPTKITISLALIASCLLSGCSESSATPTAELKEGDIIFQSLNSSQSTAIQLATHSPYTHVGILFKKGSDWQVLEAIGPVKYTSLNEWVDSGVGAHYTIKRLKNAKTLSISSLERLRRAGVRFIGKPYDPYFGWSDEKIYCSELVWKVYKEAIGIEVGVPKRLGQFDLTPPKVKAKLAERYGNNVPLNEQVVAPSTIFDSPVLTTVCSR